MTEIYILIALFATATIIGFLYSVPQATIALRQGFFGEGGLRRYSPDNDPLMFYFYVGSYLLFPFVSMVCLGVIIWTLVS